MDSVFILIFVSLGVLTVFVIGLAAYFVQFKKRVDLFFQKGDKNIEKLLVGQIKESEKQRKEIARTIEETTILKNIAQKSLQKIGLIRFNPLKNVGGDQSFSIALLDLDNNGFIVTSIYSREGNRIYAKPINNGKSEYSLSGEEEKAIEKAIDS